MNFLWTRMRLGWEGWRDKRAFLQVLPKLYTQACTDTEELGRNVLRLEKQRDRMKARIAELEADLFAPADAPPGHAPLRLTAAEIERLAILAEQCGELQQAISKVMIHGWLVQSGDFGISYRVGLERRIGAVRAAVNMMLDSGDVRLAELQAWQRNKRERLAKWAKHQEQAR